MLAAAMCFLFAPTATAALSTFVGSTFIQGAVLAGAQSKPAAAIKKKKGEACPAKTNDCHPQSWCCVKPSIWHSRWMLATLKNWRGLRCDRLTAANH
jgi:hypothetical protein